MTFGRTSIGRSVARTGQFLKRELWIWPIVAVIVLAIVGYGINLSIKSTMEESLKSQLQTLLQVESSMLEKWLRIQEGNAQSLANSPKIRTNVEQLISASSTKVGAEEIEMQPALDAAKIRTLLEHDISPSISSAGFTGYVIVDKQQVVIASSNMELLGQSASQYEDYLSQALEGKATISAPFASAVMMKDSSGRVRTGVPTMFACAPIRDQNLQVIAVLAMRIRPEREFTQILQMAQIGKTGQTIAFDKTGLLVSNTRFDEELILLGLLPDLEYSQSILTISMRDPGGNMAQGFRPKVRRAELPLTQMAASAIAGNSGVNVSGYRDFRGVPVVGAWTWLPEYQLGVATEMDYAEAFRPLTILRWAFFSLFGLLILSSIAIFLFTLSIARLQREAQKAAVEARQLGQYHLENRIGAGAMGVVYKGHHAMLRRPTAIKLLNIENVTEAAIARFEREVQITCKLTHPSTIAIYDYGRTPEGVFYYAMEYLDGIDLQKLVDKYGPQPPGRVIYILKQMCGSLYEAHSLGLVHRDIKPANVMINRRGGEPDVVKVLDFGLVKAIDEQDQARSAGLSGTPLYMSPEAIQTPDLVDACSDLYAIGAVGYYLLTGQTVFTATTLVELCQQHVASVPALPSQRLGVTFSPELECALMACLEKSRAKRPQTARDLLTMLNRAAVGYPWSLDDADVWWGRHERSLLSAANATGTPNLGSSGASLAESSRGTAAPTMQPTPPTSTSGFDRTIHHQPDDQRPSV